MNMSRGTFYNPDFDFRLKKSIEEGCECAGCVLARFGIIRPEEFDAAKGSADVIGAASPGLLRDAVEIAQAVISLLISTTMNVFGPATVINNATLAQHPEALDAVLQSYKDGMQMGVDLFAASKVLDTITRSIERRLADGPDAAPAAGSEPVQALGENELEDLVQKLLGKK